VRLVFEQQENHASLYAVIVSVARSAPARLHRHGERHRLLGRADLLAGDGELGPADVADEVNQLIGAAAKDVVAELDVAMARRGDRF
jgi:hypothetical protein